MIAQLDPLYIKTRPGKAVSRVMTHLMFQGRFLTTGHRWLNALILSQLGLFARVPALKEVTKPIFIVGTGRSGSTVLGKVLSMHRDLGFLNEPKAMWYTVEPAEDVNGHFQRGPARYRLDAEDATTAQREEARRLFSFYLLVTGSARVLDKNPELIFRTGFVRAIFPDAKFIFLVRNGWDTIHSIAAWSERRRKVSGDVVEDWWGANRRKWQLMVDELVPTEPLLCAAGDDIGALDRHEDMAAVEWVVTMQEGLRVQAALGPSMQQVRYDALTTDPRQTLQQIFDFCELPGDDVCLDYAAQVLSPNVSKDPVALPPAVERAFLQTMAALNYPAEPGPASAAK